MSSLNKFQQNIYLVISKAPRTPKATKMEIFVSTINDSQPLTVVTMNFVLDATGVLDVIVLTLRRRNVESL